MRNFISSSGAKVTPGQAAGNADGPHADLTYKIIGCAIKVHKELGPGYLESIYENALAIELQRQGLAFERQKVVKILYQGQEVGEHRIDLLIESTVLVELKSVEEVVKKHVAQVISTMKAAGAKVALLMNFNETQMIDGIQRIVL